MIKGRFYPKWYIEKKIRDQETYIKKLLPLIIIFATINSVNIYKGLRDIEDYRGREVIDKTSFIEGNYIEPGYLEKENEEGNFQALHSFDYIYEKLSTKREFIKGLRIGKEEIYLEIFLERMEEYGDTIKTLEESFFIEELSPVIEDTEHIFFKVKVKIHET